MSSNFFTQQDLARRNTRILVSLFTLAVLLLLVLTNILALVALGFAQPESFANTTLWQQLPWPTVIGISAVVLIAVMLAVMTKWMRLRAGGRVVAESLGGVRLAPDSQEPLQRRLLNVVEEMALAANTPVPPVYLLPEAGINAFAAGYSPADAVIGVTQGCLEQLDREQLQGVIAHEFSHILNGDMRMNIRLIAILNGILFLGHIGYYLLRGSRHGTAVRSRSSGNNKNGAGGILVLALGLVVIGYLGSFFGNLIKAAVSRQREFLADASAVQFTRNPSGIAGALKVIGSKGNSSRIKNPNADENSHLFFGEAISRWASLFATHPPLATRIKRLEPGWNGNYATTRKVQATADSSQPGSAGANAERANATTASADDNSSNSQRQALQQALPLLLLHSSRQREPASAILCCLLLAADDSNRLAQLKLIKQHSAALLQQVDTLCDAVSALDALQQVQLLQRLMPAVKSLPLPELKAQQQLMRQLLAQTPEPQLGAWLSMQFASHGMAVEYDKAQIQRRYSSDTLAQQHGAVSNLLALISSVAGSSEASELAWQAAFNGLDIAASATAPEPDLAALSQQLPALLALAPAQKQQLWQAIERCVHADNLLQINEHALLLALALLLQMPYPAQAGAGSA